MKAYLTLPAIVLLGCQTVSNSGGKLHTTTFNSPKRIIGHALCEENRSAMINQFYTRVNGATGATDNVFIESRSHNGVLSEVNIYELRNWTPSEDFDKSRHVIATGIFRFQSIEGGCGIVPPNDGESTLLFTDKKQDSATKKLESFTITGHSNRYNRDVQMTFAVIGKQITPNANNLRHIHGHKNCAELRAGMVNRIYTQKDAAVDEVKYVYIDGKKEPNALYSEIEVRELRGWKPGMVFEADSHVIASSGYRFQSVTGGCGVVPTRHDSDSTFAVVGTLNAAEQLASFEIKGKSKRWNRDVNLHFSLVEEK